MMWCIILLCCTHFLPLWTAIQTHWSIFISWAFVAIATSLDDELSPPVPNRVNWRKWTNILFDTGREGWTERLGCWSSYSSSSSSPRCPRSTSSSSSSSSQKYQKYQGTFWPIFCKLYQYLHQLTFWWKHQTTYLLLVKLQYSASCKQVTTTKYVCGRPEVGKLPLPHWKSDKKFTENVQIRKGLRLHAKLCRVWSHWWRQCLELTSLRSATPLSGRWWTWWPWSTAPSTSSSTAWCRGSSGSRSARRSTCARQGKVRTPPWRGTRRAAQASFHPRQNTLW